MSDDLTTTTTDTRPAFPFCAGQSLMSLQMARGHALRHGHELAGYYVPSILVEGTTTLIRTCCKEPETGGPTFPKVTRA